MLKDWKLIDNESNYKVWQSKKEKFLSLVVKTEDGLWNTFTYIGYVGSNTIYVGNSKKKALSVAKSYRIVNS